MDTQTQQGVVTRLLLFFFKIRKIGLKYLRKLILVLKASKQNINLTVHDLLMTPSLSEVSAHLQVNMTRLRPIDRNTKRYRFPNLSLGPQDLLAQV